MLGERAHDIALRQNTHNPAIGAEDDDRTDPSFGKYFYRCRKVGRGLNRSDVATLSSQDILDDHDNLPGSGRGGRPALPVLTTIRPDGRSRQEAMRCPTS
jgi:hypothetical protein